MPGHCHLCLFDYMPLMLWCLEKGRYQLGVYQPISKSGAELTPAGRQIRSSGESEFWERKKAPNLSVPLADLIN